MKIRNLVLCSMFIALSFIGANVKIVQTIAFDSMPGFLGTLILGPIYGALIGAVGHFLTAATSGFPFSLPVHIIIMIDMAITMYVFGAVYNRFSKTNNYSGIILSSAAAVVINGPISVLMIIPVLGSGMLAMIPVLSFVAFLNILIAHTVYKFLPESVKQWKLKKSEI